MTGPGATARLLLVSPPRPFGRRHGDAFSCQTNAAFQLTWAQEGFRIEDMVWHWGLDLIAGNLKTPTTVLHYPTRTEFQRELRASYTHIGFTFNPPTWHKVKPLLEDARRLAPGATLILGGYRYHRDHPHALLRLRAEVFRTRLQRTLSLFPLGIAFAPNDGVRRQLSALRRRIQAEAGHRPVRAALGSILLLLPFCWAALRHRTGWFAQPRRMRTCYGDRSP